MKSAGKARNNGLYRHIRTSKEIIRNLLNDCVLTIRKHLLKIRFERSGRGQEPSRGHKFSILENFLSIRDFTSSMRLHFRSDLVGACLPQTLLTNFLIILDFYFHYAILKW